MKFPHFIRQTFSIREGEEQSAAILIMLQFLQGSSIALLFTAAISLFLAQLPMHELPLVFIVTSFFLWLTGWLYAFLEHRMKTSNLGYFIIALNVLVILALRYGLHLSDGVLVLYALLVFYYIAYLQYNLNFWGIASLQYDIRESKRLFSIVSAGDIPAKFAGFLAALLLVKSLDPQNLLFISAGFYLLSSILINKAVPQHEESHTHDHNPNAGGLLNSFMTNGLIRQSALISLSSTAAYLVVSFILYAYIKHEFHNQVALASFIAILLSISHILKMIVKLFLADRLHRWLGYRNVLLITPVVLFFFCIMAFGFSLFSENMMALYFFGLMAVLADLLRSAIQYPMLMIGMQVLPVHTRMAGHTLMKGFMDPIAYLFVGGVLYLSATGGEIIDLRILGVLLLAILIIGIVVNLPIERQYMAGLSSAIRLRTLGSRTIQLTDTRLFRQAMKTVQSENKEEAIFILRVLDTEDERWDQIVKIALKHPSHEVRKSAIILIAQKEKKGFNKEIKAALAVENDPGNIHEMLQLLLTEEGTEILADYINHPDFDVRMASLSFLLRYPEHIQYSRTEQEIKELLAQTDHKSIILGLRVLANSERPGFIPLDRYLASIDPKVVKAAVDTAGKIRDTTQITKLFTLLTQRDYYPGVIAALTHMGEDVVRPAVEQASTTSNSNLRHKLLLLLATHNSEIACEGLFQLLREWPDDLGLLLDHLSNHKHAHILKGQMAPYIDKLQRLAESQFCLKHSLKSNKEFDLLTEAIEKEFLQVRTFLLLAIYLHFGDQRLKKTFTGVAGSKEIVASAIELLEQVCGEQKVAGFVRLYEPMPVNDRIIEMNKKGIFKTFTPTAAMDEIINANHPPHSNWLRSLVLFIMVREPNNVKSKLPETLRNSSNNMIKELTELLGEQQTD